MAAIKRITNPISRKTVWRCGWFAKVGLPAIAELIRATPKMDRNKTAAKSGKSNLFQISFVFNIGRLYPVIAEITVNYPHRRL